MVLIDERVGSRELLPYFKPYGVQVESTRLESGDAAFSGNGQDGTALIGIERKRIGDFVQSMRSRRLAGFQLDKLSLTYDYIFLMVEGIYRPGDRGELEEYRGGRWRGLGLMYREVSAHLTTLELKAGVKIRRTGTAQETVAEIVGLYKYFEKPWGLHRSHQSVYAPVPEGKKVGFVSLAERIRRKYGEKGLLAFKIAAQLDGIDSKAENVVVRLPTPEAVFTASEKEWMEVKGVGRVLAKRIVEILH